ncbi:MAG: hypothetical protein ABI042_14890 [Verrucomicrobiota bacterium]
MKKFVSPFQGFNLFFVAHTQGVALGYPVLRFQRAAYLLALSIIFLFCGCVNSLHPYNTPSDQTLKIVSPTPQQYVLKVNDALNGLSKHYEVGSDGIVNFHVPSLPRGCAVRFLDVIKIADHRLEDVQAIELVKDGKSVRKLSLDDIAKLELDPNGIPRLKAK